MFLYFYFVAMGHDTQLNQKSNKSEREQEKQTIWSLYQPSGSKVDWADVRVIFSG